MGYRTRLPHGGQAAQALGVGSAHFNSFDGSNKNVLIPFRYTFVDEITWIKVNQINATVVTGRTGHWLNHAKESCLIGVKGEPKLQRLMDLNIIVEAARGTSQKPDAVCFFSPYFAPI
jgi:N6-adenosine-specific RNA methylase IME4